MRPKLAALALAMLLAGCANQQQQAAEGPFNFEEMKASLIVGKSRYWKDPDSIRDARVSHPFSCWGGIEHIATPPDSCLCVEANAKNAMGGYTGLQRNTFFYSKKLIVGSLPPRSQDACDPLVPFAELNGAVAMATPSPAARK